MAKRKTITVGAINDITPIDPPTSEPKEIIVTPKKELILEGDPEAQLAFATKAANALMTVVKNKPKPVIIRGKQYLEYGDWQVLGRFYGATVEIEWTKKLLNSEGKTHGYEARALVNRNGETIASAEGMCTTDEERWGDAEEYAIRSMAQTRTAAKALRNAFGWVAELAGYSATPAEEMPRDDYRSNNQGATIDISDENGSDVQVATDDTQSVAWKQRQALIYIFKRNRIDPLDKDACERFVADRTGLALVEGNFQTIIEKLEEPFIVTGAKNN